jgi:putative acetyltransferase
VLIETLSARHSVIIQLAVEQQQELVAIEGPAHLAGPLNDGTAYVAGFVDGRPVACGAVQPLGDRVGEVRRMYVRPPYRGRGYGRLILAALEELALERGFHIVRLEIGRGLAPALRLCVGAGYHPIPLYGDYVGNAGSLCFEKLLTPVEV